MGVYYTGLPFINLTQTTLNVKVAKVDQESQQFTSVDGIRAEICVIGSYQVFRNGL